MIYTILIYLTIQSDMRFITAVECWQRQKRIYRVEANNKGM